MNAVFPEWMPRDDLRLLRCGEQWDAVRQPLFVGREIALRLIAVPAPAIMDVTHDGSITWLVRPGSAAGWEELGADVLGKGRGIAVPPPSWTGNQPIRWDPAPTETCLTDPHALYDAMRRAISASKRGGVR